MLDGRRSSSPTLASPAPPHSIGGSVPPSDAVLDDRLEPVDVEWDEGGHDGGCHDAMASRLTPATAKAATAAPTSEPTSQATPTKVSPRGASTQVKPQMATA